MIVDDNNYDVGNKAMAQVLLLYYHLVKSGGFFDGNTVYIDQDDFNALKFIDVKVIEKPNTSLDIDEGLLRKGATIYLLSILNDMVQEEIEYYHQLKLVKEIVSVLEAHKKLDIPEVERFLECFLFPENELRHELFNEILHSIYNKYVLGFFKGEMQA